MFDSIRYYWRFLCFNMYYIFNFVLYFVFVQMFYKCVCDGRSIEIDQIKIIEVRLRYFCCNMNNIFYV